MSQSLQIAAARWKRCGHPSTSWSWTGSYPWSMGKSTVLQQRTSRLCTPFIARWKFELFYIYNENVLHELLYYKMLRELSSWGLLWLAPHWLVECRFCLYVTVENGRLLWTLWISAVESFKYLVKRTKQGVLANLTQIQCFLERHGEDQQHLFLLQP